MNALLLLDTELFLEACDVTILEDEEAQQAVADVLLEGENLSLEQPS